MTEQPFRTNSTRSLHGANPPLEPRAASRSRPPVETRSPYPSLHPSGGEKADFGSSSRPPLPPPLERRQPQRHYFLRTISCLALGAVLVFVGWNLLPHNNAETKTIFSTQTSPGEPGSVPAPPSEQAVEAQPAATASRTRDTVTDYREPGLRHIATLQLAGSHSQAADYAVAAPLEYRRDYVIVAYHEWGRHHPDLALASAIRIEEGFSRDWAVQSVFSGWARNDPEGMAEAVLAFPESTFKKAALTKALRAWMNKDPNVAGDWIMSHPDAVIVADDMFRRDHRD